MLPVLLDLKFIKIYTFGVFLVLSFFWGSFMLWKNIRLTQHSEDDVFDGLFLSMFSGLFFGRLVYVVVNFKEFGFSFMKFILINGYPGLSVYGAIGGGALALFLYFLSKKINFRSIGDYFVTPLFIALIFGKLGSFFSGSEVGAVTKFFLKIKYVGFKEYRHLTSFYEALLLMVGAYISYRLLFEIRKEKLQKGFLMYFFLWYFSLVLFVFDKMKVVTLYFHGYSFNRMVSIILLLTTSVYFIYYFKVNISEFIKTYGDKAFKKINRATKRKTSEGEEKNAASN
ncbi:MAG: Prolipoprotein diacylglyceryl transferase, partial [Candidatus Roizmanbacteria bacterium GW2011_GWC2_35_12]